MALSSKSREKINEWMTWYNAHANEIEKQPLEVQVKWMHTALLGAYTSLSLLSRELNDEMKTNSTASGIIVPGARW